MKYIIVPILILVGLVGGCQTVEDLRYDKSAKHFQLETRTELEIVYSNLILNFEKNWQTWSCPLMNTLRIVKVISPNKNMGTIYLQRTEWGGVEIVIDLRRLENNYTLVDVSCNWAQEFTVRDILAQSIPKITVESK